MLPTAAPADSCATFPPLLVIPLMQRFDPQTIMFPASLFHPGRQPGFTTRCFTSKSEEGGVFCHRFGALLFQLLVCLTVFFPGGNTHTFTNFATQNQNDVQVRGAKMHQIHSTPTNIMTAPVEQKGPSEPEGLTFKLGKTQEPIKWFRNRFNEICGFSPDQEQLEPLPFRQTKLCPRHP